MPYALQSRKVVPRRSRDLEGVGGLTTASNEDRSYLKLAACFILGQGKEENFGERNLKGFSAESKLRHALQELYPIGHLVCGQGLQLPCVSATPRQLRHLVQQTLRNFPGICCMYLAKVDIATD